MKVAELIPSKSARPKGRQHSLASRAAAPQAGSIVGQTDGTAQVLADHVGTSYLTPTELKLRRAHAAARDAVRTELALDRDLGKGFVRRWKLFDVTTVAEDKNEYLLRPDLGRRLSEATKHQLLTRCPEETDLQIAIGDGLSVTAVVTQVPRLLPLIVAQADARGWKSGQPFFIRYCRVGVMNDLGELLRPRVLVLLIGERPGLATAESLSAYMAYRPKAGDDDSNRNVISNIHRCGVSAEAAAQRIANFAQRMMREKMSGVSLKEEIGSDVRPMKDNIFFVKNQREQTLIKSKSSF